MRNDAIVNGAIVNSAIVNVYEAKTHLSQLLDRVANGEEIVIARGGVQLHSLCHYRSSVNHGCLGHGVVV